MKQNSVDRFPKEVTFKVICKNLPYLYDIIYGACSEHATSIIITQRESETSKFISFTVTATFTTDEHIQKVCTAISSIEGFITMF